jgi:hypothetical protein
MIAMSSMGDGSGFVPEGAACLRQASGDELTAPVSPLKGRLACGWRLSMN